MGYSFLIFHWVHQRLCLLEKISFWKIKKKLVYLFIIYKFKKCILKLFKVEPFFLFFKLWTVNENLTRHLYIIKKKNPSLFDELNKMFKIMVVQKPFRTSMSLVFITTFWKICSSAFLMFTECLRWSTFH